MSKASKNKPLRCGPRDFATLAKLGSASRAQFSPEPLQWYSDFIRGVIRTGLPELSDLFDKHITPITTAPLEAVFGKFRPQHAFHLAPFDWGFKIREPDATKAIAALLGTGENPIRAHRIHAFIQALGVQDVPRLEYLMNARTHGEYLAQNRSRIDILIDNIETEKAGVYRAIVIEAKFGHTITGNRKKTKETETDGKSKGQIRNYYETIKKRKDYNNTPDCFILGLTEKAKSGLKGKQTKIWKFISWRDLWLGFEKQRPDEDNPSLTFFMNTLWHRIGGLNPKDTK